MKRLIVPIAIILSLLGGFNGYQSWRFVNSAQNFSAVVTEVRELRGPPKPRQRTPVTLVYRTSKGESVSATATLPLLTIIKEGDQIPILVDPAAPTEAKLPLWSELWAKPLTYLISGSLLFIARFVLASRRFR